MQRTFDDLGQPLHEVTFVVFDVETTGASARDGEITEIGAVKLRGGECLGTFQTLVNPGTAIPPSITYLTGITQTMVLPAPPLEAVLPLFLEFVGSGVVLVGHNVRFDISFLHAACDRLGYPRPALRFVDTCALARRLVRDEVPNCRLDTLARHFRTRATPIHRALDDARATSEVLHCLLERAGSLGVTGLDDLLALPTTAGHPQAGKLKLVDGLPRKPGVYLFKDGQGRVLYVGKAVDLRRRVRSYFAGDERRKVGQLLREVHTIDHIVCTGELEASVVEVRLIHELLPRFNRQAKLWSRYAYLKLTLDERFPRLSVVRVPKPGDGCLYVGPLASTGAARLVQDAIETAVPIRRCTKKPSTRNVKPGPCAPAQLGVSTCPCAGDVTPEEYERLVATVVRGLTDEPRLLLDPLARRMDALSESGRYEEAATMRDRASALARALARQRRLDGLRRAGRLTVEVPGEGGAVVEHGRLVVAWAGSTPPPPTLPFLLGDSDGDQSVAALADPKAPVPRHLADELSCVAAWLDAKAARARIVGCAGELTSPMSRLPSFEPRRAAAKPVQTSGLSLVPSGRPNGSENVSGPAAAPSSPMVARPS